MADVSECEPGRLYGSTATGKACQASEVEAPPRGRLIVLDGGVRQQRRRGRTNGLVPVDLTDVARERTKQRKRRARVRWTDKLRQVLVAAYRQGGVGEAKRAIKLVRPDLSDQCIVQELNRLGLRTPEPRPRRPLGEKDQAFVLNSLGGSTFRLLAEELKRPTSTIWSFARRRGYSAEHQTESFKCKDVAEMLG